MVSGGRQLQQRCRRMQPTQGFGWLRGHGRAAETCRNGGSAAHPILKSAARRTVPDSDGFLHLQHFCFWMTLHFGPASNGGVVVFVGDFCAACLPSSGP